MSVITVRGDAFEATMERNRRRIQEAFGLTSEDRVHEYPKTNPDSTDNDRLARYEHRAASTRHAMHWLQPNPNLPEHARDIAEIVWGTAEQLVQVLGDGIELDAGLRKLREAKDCFVIQALEDGDFS
jgi:hypothetical protein